MVQSWAWFTACEFTVCGCYWVSHWVGVGSPPGSLVSSHPSPFQKHISRWIGYSQLLLGVKQCLSVFVHGALCWTGVPKRVYSHLTTIVPRIDFGSTTTLTRMMNLLKMKEWIEISAKERVKLWMFEDALPILSTGVFKGRKPCFMSWSIVSSSSACISDTMLQGMRPDRPWIAPR